MATSHTGSVSQPGAAAIPGPVAYFAANPVAANLLMLFFIIGGIIAGTHLAVQHFPPVDVRTVTVTVPFPGASPREVEADVNRRIEESVIGLAGVTRVVSTANEGFGQIRIELATFADAGTVLDDAQTAVDSIENFPQVTVDPPEVELQQLALEVMTLAVSSTTADENALRIAAEHVREELLELPAISQVQLKGTRDREIAIELSEKELRRHNLTFNQLSNILQAALVVAAAVYLLRSESVRMIILDRNASISGNVQADPRLPVGAPFDATLATAEHFVSAGHAVNEQFGGTAIRSISIVAGNIASTGLMGKDDGNASHLASVKLHLHERPIRTASPAEIERLWRLRIGDVSYLESVEFQTARTQERPSVAFALQHDDEDVLRHAATELRGFMAGMPGLYEISDSLSLGKRHFEIELTPAGRPPD